MKHALSLVSIGSPTVGVVVSWEQNLEFGLRVAALASTIAIGWLTFYFSQKRKNRDDD